MFRPFELKSWREPCQRDRNVVWNRPRSPRSSVPILIGVLVILNSSSQMFISGFILEKGWSHTEVLNSSTALWLDVLKNNVDSKLIQVYMRHNLPSSPPPPPLPPEMKTAVTCQHKIITSQCSIILTKCFIPSEL